MRRAALLALLAACATTPAAPRPAPADPPAEPGPWGLMIHTPYHAEVLSTLGVQWVRLDVRWADAEPAAPGAYAWEGVDKLLGFYLERGQHVVALLGVAELPQAYRARPEDDAAWGAAYAAWAGAVAARYAGRGLTYELGNEPEAASPGGLLRDPERYARLASRAARAIRAADPGAHVAAPAMAWVDRNYLARALAAGLLEGGVDTLSYHGYHRRDLTPESGLAEDVAWLREQAARAAPGRAIHLIDSERGYALHPDQPKPWAVWRNWVGTESEQAAFLARHYLASLAAGVEVVVWYKDLWGEEGFSLYYADERDPRGLRPMGRVYRSLSRLLPDPPARERNDRYPVTLLNDLHQMSDPNTLLRQVSFLRRLPGGGEQLVVALWNPLESRDGQVLAERRREGENYVERWRPARPEDGVVLEVRAELHGAAPARVRALRQVDLLADPAQAPAALAPELRDGRLLTPRVPVGPLPTVLVFDLAP